MDKAFLKWAGGKSKLLPVLLDQIGTVNGTYFEPFLGSGVVALNVKANNYFLSDINKELINLYLQIKENGVQFISKCKTYFENGLYNNKESFYKLRTEFNTTDCAVTKAALFIYLNRHAFNGLCRFNSKGGFNVPFGKYNTVYFPEKELLNFYNNSTKFDISLLSFDKVFCRASKGDVIYCDPPYAPLDQISNFTSYSKETFGPIQQQELATLAKTCKCKVIISNHDTEFTRELYKEADQILELFVRRSVGAASSSRAQVKELLAIFNN